MKIIVFMLAIMSFSIFANEDDHHDHSHDEKSESHKDHDEYEGEHDDHAEHEHGSSKAVGDGKAITAVDEVKGFSLSVESIKLLGVEFKNAVGTSIDLPHKALVVNRTERGFYRLRGGFFKFVVAKKVEETSDGYRVLAPDWKFGDRIVVNKVDLIRVSDIYSTDDAEYGHSH